jgi:thiol-disulfide isomerase/thioredoxin
VCVLLCSFCLIQLNKKSDIPDVRGKLLNGDSINLRTLTKDKVTVLNVWGIFCHPCMNELPLLHKVYDKYRNNKDFAFVTVAMDSENELLKFLELKDSTNPYRKMYIESGLDSFYLPTLAYLPHGYLFTWYPHVLDSVERSEFRTMIRSDAIPTTLIYNRQGKLIFKQIGSFDDTTVLYKKLDKILKEK